MTATPIADSRRAPIKVNLGSVFAQLPIIRLSILGIVLLTLVTACSSLQPADPVSVLQTAYQHANNGDIESFMALVHPSATFINDRGRYNLPETIRRHFQRIYQEGTFRVELSDLKSEGNSVTYSYEKYQGDELIASGQDGIAIVSDGLIIFDHSKAHSTPIPDSYYSWSTYTSEEVGLQIDYPAYFDLSPFSDYGCAPLGISDEGQIHFGDNFYITSSDAEGFTLEQALEEALREHRKLGYIILRKSWGDIMGLPAVTIEDRETLLGMTFKHALFIHNGILYEILVSPESGCVDIAIAQGHADALTERDIFTIGS